MFSQDPDVGVKCGCNPGALFGHQPTMRKAVPGGWIVTLRGSATRGRDAAMSDTAADGMPPAMAPHGRPGPGRSPGRSPAARGGRGRYPGGRGRLPGRHGSSSSMWQRTLCRPVGGPRPLACLAGKPRLAFALAGRPVAARAEQRDLRDGGRCWPRCRRRRQRRRGPRPSEATRSPERCSHPAQSPRTFANCAAGLSRALQIR